MHKKRKKEKHKFYGLQQVYFIYLAVLPALAFYGMIDYYELNHTSPKESLGVGAYFLALMFFGGFISLIVYSVITEIIQVPERLMAALLMILDAPILLFGLKLFSADVSYFQFFTFDYFIEVTGFITCLGVLCIFPSWSKGRVIAFDSDLSAKGFAVFGIMVFLIWSLYYPYGFMLMDFLKRQSIFNQIPIYTAYISTTYIYIRYMSSGFSRDNSSWILITLGLWIVGMMSGHFVVNLFH